MIRIIFLSDRTPYEAYAQHCHTMNITLTGVFTTYDPEKRRMTLEFCNADTVEKLRGYCERYDGASPTRFKLNRFFVKVRDVYHIRAFDHRGDRLPLEDLVGKMVHINARIKKYNFTTDNTQFIGWNLVANTVTTVATPDDL